MIDHLPFVADEEIRDALKNVLALDPDGSRPRRLALHAVGWAAALREGREPTCDPRLTPPVVADALQHATASLREMNAERQGRVVAEARRENIREAREVLAADGDIRCLLRY
jgi:hypothetical protein